MMDWKHTYELTLTGTDSTVPAVQRLQSAFKVLLRAFGQRCVAIHEVTEELEDQNKSDDCWLDAKPIETLHSVLAKTDGDIRERFENEPHADLTEAVGGWLPIVLPNGTCRCR